jgi:hypothetical protein
VISKGERAVERENTRKEGLGDLSNRELLSHIMTTLSEFMRKQAQLIKVEVLEELRSGLFMVGGFGVAALALFITVILLLVTLVMALSAVLPGWAAGLIVAGFTLLISLVAALIGWQKRPRAVLPRSQEVIKEDVQWTKELLQ